MKDDDRYLKATRVECADLGREQLLRRIAALSRRLDSETRVAAARKKYSSQLAAEGSENGS